MTSYDWIDRGSYILCPAPQGNRIHAPSSYSCSHKRLTASIVGMALGHSTFSTPLDLAREMLGSERSPIAPEQRQFIDHGVSTEPLARDWYCRVHKSTVKEVGVAIPKWDNRISAAVDGIVMKSDGTESDGIIEIKCPQRFYASLESAPAPTGVETQSEQSPHQTTTVPLGTGSPPCYHDHIFRTHYDQMQLGMKILNKLWCDYIVYSTSDNRMYVERVPYSQSYWATIMQPGIDKFFDETFFNASMEIGMPPTIDTEH
jgi:hypothetical protein